MNKKFAAVTSVLLSLMLTTCSSPAAEARQFNTETKQLVQFSETLKALKIKKNEEIKNLMIQAKLNTNTRNVNIVIKKLKKQANKTPYVYSGISPKFGWDCSGLVMWTYNQLGISLKHSAGEQSRSGKRVSYKNAKPGDVVIFSNHKDGANYHSAIYLGNGMIIDANSFFKTTVIEPLTNFKDSKIVFRRLIDTK